MNTSASTAPTPPGGEARPQRPDRPVLETRSRVVRRASDDAAPGTGVLHRAAADGRHGSVRGDRRHRRRLDAPTDAGRPARGDAARSDARGDPTSRAAPGSVEAEDHRSSGRRHRRFPVPSPIVIAAPTIRAARRHANAHARAARGARQLAPSNVEGLPSSKGRAGCPDRCRGGGTDVRPKHHRGRLLRAPGPRNRGEPGAMPPRLAGNGSSSPPAVTDTMIDDVARRVIQRLALGSSEQMQAIVKGDRVWRRGTARPRRNRSHQAAGRRRRGR